MLRIVAYDVADPKRLSRVAKVCEDFGVRVEKSVFECNLDEKRFEELWRRLEAEIESEEDSLVAYRVCVCCEHPVVTAGRTIRPEPQQAFIF